ncbi:neuronal acetylcholine receptor subunit alpha-10 [Octopus vulgaris]|uniref:Neuronal acetylcholine receptor subunit alpha-10 n=1 Tax=Octopus vulgaris TaxID=6645 RepID=A0AA36FI71_OCTVU|nr:neuronal acetylcholine receptor subunit alpha-10 [Octopus vulgaris]
MAISRPRIFIFSAVFLFVLQFFPQAVLSGEQAGRASPEAQKRLIDHISTISDTLVVPTTDEAVTVSLDLMVNNIQMDEHGRKFTVDAYFSQRWKDVTLRWDPNAYDNIKQIRLPASYFWTPDIVLYNL